MRHPLPLNALRAFEAAARLGSFTRAADELTVTPAAVGQQVRGLEARLGRPLLRRSPDGLSPTEEAERAMLMLHRGFDCLAQGFEYLSVVPSDRRIAVSVAPTFAIKWLVPRLHRFHAHHPEIEVSFDTAMRFVDLARGDADLAIRFGDGVYYGLQRERLFGEWVLPVCAPELCTGARALRRPSDLVDVPLIHIREETSDETWAGWPDWSEKFAVEDERYWEGASFSQSVTALEAALAGQGVALCGLSYALADIEAGRLCAPFGTGCAIRTRYAYDMVYTPLRAESRAVLSFRRWMKSEAEETRRRLTKFLSV
jgi:LysR family glycine cleavage system transcriptional activator